MNETERKQYDHRRTSVLIIVIFYLEISKPVSKARAKLIKHIKHIAAISTDANAGLISILFFIPSFRIFDFNESNL